MRGFNGTPDSTGFLLPVLSLGYWARALPVTKPGIFTKLLEASDQTALPGARRPGTIRAIARLITHNGGGGAWLFRRTGRYLLRAGFSPERLNAT
jgi:hypothetical protein